MTNSSSPRPDEALARVGCGAAPDAGGSDASAQVIPSAEAPAGRTARDLAAVYGYEAGLAAGRREALEGLRAYVAELRARARLGDAVDIGMDVIADEIEERFLRAPAGQSAMPAKGGA